MFSIHCHGPAFRQTKDFHITLYPSWLAFDVSSQFRLQPPVRGAPRYAWIEHCGCHHSTCDIPKVWGGTAGSIYVISMSPTTPCCRTGAQVLQTRVLPPEFRKASKKKPGTLSISWKLNVHSAVMEDVR